MPTIDPARLMADLRKLRGFGACGKGVVRPSLSPIDMEARRWLRGRMADAGLDARIDGLGTVFGRSTRPGRALVIGSHTDTQPQGGWLDGALGVIYALEIVRALSEDPETAGYAIDIASWIDEESTYSGFLGSRAFIGNLDASVIQSAASRDGTPLAVALAAADLDGRAGAVLEPDRHVAYLEAHIEQGPVLEASGKRIGVVTGVVGIRTVRIILRGRQNHAGTTPMHLRRDAGFALVTLIGQIHETFAALAAERTVWTVGHISLEPGASSIIPGWAEMVLQYRDLDDEVLERLETALASLVAQLTGTGQVAVSLEAIGPPAEPCAMDESLQAALAAAAEHHAPGSWIRMPSGAGHDAQIIARHLPAGMLFVPSIGGISHDFAEDTSEGDIALGCQVLATAAAAILRDATRGDFCPGC